MGSSAHWPKTDNSSWHEFYSLSTHSFREDSNNAIKGTDLMRRMNSYGLCCPAVPSRRAESNTEISGTSADSDDTDGLDMLAHATRTRCCLDPTQATSATMLPIPAGWTGEHSGGVWPVAQGGEVLRYRCPTAG